MSRVPAALAPGPLCAAVCACPELRIWRPQPKQTPPCRPHRPPLPSVSTHSRETEKAAAAALAPKLQAAAGRAHENTKRFNNRALLQSVCVRIPQAATRRAVGKSSTAANYRAGPLDSTGQQVSPTRTYLSSTCRTGRSLLPGHIESLAGDPSRLTQGAPLVRHHAGDFPGDYYSSANQITLWRLTGDSQATHWTLTFTGQSER